MYTLDNFIRENDKDNKIKKAVADCLMENMSKEVAIDILANDLQVRLYDFIYDSEELNIDDGSNIKRDFVKAIKDIISEYFTGTVEKSDTLK